MPADNTSSNLTLRPTILQFGTGRLLRGLFDPMVSESSSITVVQSRLTGGMAGPINSAEFGYKIWVRGIQNGRSFQQIQQVNSLGTAYIAGSQWGGILQLANQSDYRLVVSNTTEKGLRLERADDAIDDWDTIPPASFPARLLQWLYRRFTFGQRAVTIMPVELVEHNAATLKQLCLEQLSLRSQMNADGFRSWLSDECRWLSTLVDRICVSPVDAPDVVASDPLAVMTEPYQLLAVADDGRDRSVLPDHPSIVWTEDLQPFFRRKVRILNGLHTLMVARCHGKGYRSVIDVMNDDSQLQWLTEVLNQEILPTLESQGLDPTDFANDVVERFKNPFFEHLLSDIAIGHAEKIQIRLLPTIAEHRETFGKDPVRMVEAIGSGT